MSHMLPPTIDVHVNDLIDGFAAIGELARTVAGPSDGYNFNAWMSEFEFALIDGFMQAIPSLDDEGREVIRRVIRGERLSPADRANLAYSLVDATQVIEYMAK